MIDLSKVRKDDVVYCPSLGVAFLCRTKEERELVKKYNERVKEA